MGCLLLCEGGRHSWWVKPLLIRRTAIPRQRETNELLAQKVCRDPGIAESDIRDDMFARRHRLGPVGDYGLLVGITPLVIMGASDV